MKGGILVTIIIMDHNLFIYLITDSNMSNMSMRNAHGIMAIGGQQRAEICY
jgi:hypothetical protein